MLKEELKQKILSELQQYPQRQYIRRLALFGSQVRGRKTGRSDVDLLVTFEPNAPVGFFEFVRFQQYLEARLGRPVDLVTEQGLSRYFRDRVIKQAEVVYGG